MSRFKCLGSDRAAGISCVGLRRRKTPLRRDGSGGPRQRQSDSTSAALVDGESGGSVTTNCDAAGAHASAAEQGSADCSDRSAGGKRTKKKVNESVGVGKKHRDG